MKVAYNPGRLCDGCGSKMPPFFPRTRMGDQLLCTNCVSRIEAALTKAALTKVAHDSNDDSRIFHCPFCGSGQVIANSDGGVQCEFCGTTFVVRVQPEFDSMPQTIDGTPYERAGEPEPGEFDEAPEVEGEDPVMADDGVMGPEQNFVPKKDMFTTSSGARLGRDDYIRHLALRHASDKEAALRQMKVRK